jgi:glycosyltransferase involved in cell wall biosynthesis
MIPILQTCFSRSWGGLEMQALEVSQHLHRRGYPLWLACLPGSRLQGEAERRGVRVLPLRAAGFFHPTVVLRMARFIRREEISILHCQLSHDLSMTVPAAHAARSSPAVILSKRMGSFLNKKDPFHRYVYARIDRILAISEVIRQNVINTTPIPPERVLTLHDAINLDEFTPTPGVREQIRREFSYHEDDIVIGFVGRFSRGKGHEDLLLAAREIMPLRPNVRFLIAGEASVGEEMYEKEIYALAASLDLGKAVTFAGYRRDIPRILAGCDLFVFPSHAEAFGVSLIEAMAANLPAVASSSDGILDIVVDGETGLLVNPQRPPELAGALLRLIDNPALRRQLGEAARKRVSEKFERTAQIDRLEQIYDQVLEEKKRAR